MRKSEFFFGQHLIPDTTSIGSKNEQNCFDALRPGKISLQPSDFKNRHPLFKLPTSNGIPTKRQTLRATISPRRRVLSGRVKNDVKSMQGSKMSFRPCGRFLNSNAKFSSSNLQKKMRQELIQKMVYLTECGLKENNEIKHSTPVKLMPTLTPKKTPRSKSYLILPEFVKKVPDLNELRTPIKDFVKRETMYCSSVKKTPVSVKKLPNFPKFNISNIIEENESYNEEVSLISVLKNSKNYANSSKILHDFQAFNVQVGAIYENLKTIENNFKEDVTNFSENEIHHKFFFYLEEKQKLNDQIKALEEELIVKLKNEKDIKEGLKKFVRDNETLFNKQLKLHKEFQCAVDHVLSEQRIAIEKVEDEKLNDKLKKIIIEESIKKESNKREKCILLAENKSPVLRRSLRLSKLPLVVKEITPLKKKLSKTNMKKGAQKNRISSK